MVEKRGIELVPKELEAEKKRVGLLRSARLVGFIFLGAVALTTAVLYLVVNSRENALSDLNRQVSDRESTISELSEIEGKVTALTSKNNLFTKIFSSRKYYSLLLEALQKSTPIGVTVTDLTTVQGEARLSGSVQSYLSLDNFLRSLVDPAKGGALFEEVSLTSVSYDSSTGGAEFTAEVTIEEDGLLKNEDGE
jgi:Tfp pilus assembly protein PilN